MCSQGSFKKLDSVLSHARHWRMAVKYETQCTVPDPIAQDMSLVLHPLVLKTAHLLTKEIVYPRRFKGGIPS